MNKKMMATAAGIITLIGGSLQIIIGIVAVIGALAGPGGSEWTSYAFWYLCIIAGIPLLITGHITFYGGICALRKKHYSFALVGAFLSIGSFLAPALFYSLISYFSQGFIAIPIVFSVTAIPVTLVILSRSSFVEDEPGNKDAPKIAGILIIILALMQLTGLILDINEGLGGYSKIATIFEQHGVSFFSSITGRYILLSLIMIPFHLYAVFCGICSFLVRRWRLALSGSILLLIVSILTPLLNLPAFGSLASLFFMSYVFAFLISICVIIFIWLSRPVFVRNSPHPK